MNSYILYGIIITLSLNSIVSLVPNQSIGKYASILGGFLAFLLSLFLYTQNNFYNQWFYIDYISKIMIIIITGTYFIGVLHSSICIKDMKDFYLPPNYYWVLLSLFALTMVLAISTPNIGYAWFWLETSTIVSAALILLERGKSHVESAWRYILIASSGLGMALLSVILFGWATGSFIWYNAQIERGTALIGVLALLGFGAKAGLFPVHTWLPDAHGTAPSPVSAMLSGALLPAALTVYYRIFNVLHSPLLYNLSLIIGIITLWVAGFLMIAQKRIKRLFAYSSMDVMGIATVGIALTYVNQNVINYVMIIFIAHALGKSSLFLIAGVLKRKGHSQIAKVKNLASSPLIGSAMIISAFTVTGAPPFPMFFGEIGIIINIASSTYALIFLLGGIILSFLALNYHILKMLFEKGDPKIKINFVHSIVPFTVSLLAIVLSIILYISYWRWFL